MFLVKSSNSNPSYLQFIDLEFSNSPLKMVKYSVSYSAFLLNMNKHYIITWTYRHLHILPGVSEACPGTEGLSRRWSLYCGCTENRQKQN